MDDKMVLTEVHLLESRCYWATGNGAKAKVSRVDRASVRQRGEEGGKGRRELTEFFSFQPSSALA